MFEVDHLFVCTDFGAPEAEWLVEFGLTEGAPNVHPGQGTANRRFFFRNAMLELLWVRDAEEAQSGVARPTLLWPRWSGRKAGASPFGVCLRATQPGSTKIPFPSWEYRPPYLPHPDVIHVGPDTPLSEPMWFYLGFGRRPDAEEMPRRQPLDHAAGFREVTHVRLMTPGADSPSEAARAVARTRAVTLEAAQEHLLEITFDGGARARSNDFRPALPLVFRW